MEFMPNSQRRKTLSLLNTKITADIITDYGMHVKIGKTRGMCQVMYSQDFTAEGREKTMQRSAQILSSILEVILLTYDSSLMVVFLTLIS